MHYSVLLKESIDGLAIKDDGLYVDCTLGYAGHSSEILKRIKTGKLFAFDADSEAINYSKGVLSKIHSNYEIIHSNFVNLKQELEKRNIAKVDGILFDLGVSSPQIDNPERGFSFMNDGPLDMRMNKESVKSAKTVVNEYKKEELANIFFTYGEEKMSKVIAKTILEERKVREIDTTKELVGIIKKSVGAKYFNKEHPERKIFQAIRIEVNDELKVLENALLDAIELLNEKGRIVVITFHSLEDRIVKQIFKNKSEINEIVKGLPEIPEEYRPTIKLINKKPVVPNGVEIKENSRSKSAKLRIIERI